jgi:polyferredoxin
MNETVARIGMIAALVLLSIISGRLFCGKICPLGLFQDLLSKIPFPIKIKSFKADKYLRYIKYALLILMLIASVTGQEVQGTGNNTRSFPLSTIISVVILVIISVILERPFCKYICPYGAIIAPGNKISLFKYRLDEKKCIQCGICTKNCKMNLEPYKTPNHLECIRCGKCKKVCPYKAIAFKAGK